MGSKPISSSSITSDAIRALTEESPIRFTGIPCPNSGWQHEQAACTKKSRSTVPILQTIAILVIYGKTGKGAAKCIHGGAAFVWPLFQAYAWLELEPFVVPIDLNNALSQENIRVTVPTTVTVAVSTEEGIMQNAAVRLLGQGIEEVKAQAQSVILGQMRQVMATMRIEEINRDRQAFMTKVNESLSVELEKIGLSVINVNIKDIEDDSGYIKALGRKAAAEAVNQALVDVAEQEKMAPSVLRRDNAITKGL